LRREAGEAHSAVAEVHTARRGFRILLETDHISRRTGQRSRRTVHSASGQARSPDREVQILGTAGQISGLAGPSSSRLLQTP